MFSLIPWRTKKEKRAEAAPFENHPIARLRNEFDALFDRWGQLLAPLEAENEWARFWDFHLEDTDKEFLVKAELPGFDQDELDVQVSGQVLTIKAEKKQESKEEKHYSSYHRSVTLPRGADLNKIDARYKNGVLQIHVPKTEEAQGKRIAVKS